MLTVIVSWIYISVICLLIGIAVLDFLKIEDIPVTYYFIAGIIAITVYVEVLSVSMKIGILAHSILLAAAVLTGVIKRSKLRNLWKEYCLVICSWEFLFYCCFILLVAFCTSRGEFHTDTNIYHAAAIRLYEEYGLIKGVGNLQLHYAYNSSYLAFAAIFSMRCFWGRSLHTTTGFLTIIMCLYAFHGLKNYRQHVNHITDFMRAGILFYALVNVTRSMSPATDYAAMYFVLFIMTAWCENLFEMESDITIYAVLSVAAVFACTIKFSTACLVLITIWPAYDFIKNKHWKKVLLYLFYGCVVLFPFLIRNYFVSGWLLYPFDKIDVFCPVWKVPIEYLRHDADQIKVWGRCLYDVGKVNLPVNKWVSVWWEHQFRYEQMFLGAFVCSSILQTVMFLHRIKKKQGLRIQLVILHIAIWSSIILWFLMAPFIRYGLAFLFAVIMIAVGDYLSEQKKAIYSILTGGLLFCIVVSVSPYWDQYITDAGVFLKHNLKEPYYIVQKDYDSGNMEACEIRGNKIYFAVGEEINSYHVFPGTCYQHMLERSTLIGDRIEDGFRAK